MNKKLSIISLGWMGRYVYNHFCKSLSCSGSYHSAPKNLKSEFEFNINSFTELPVEILEAEYIFFNLPPSKVVALESLDRFFKSVESKRVILISSTSVYEGFGIFDEDSALLYSSSRSKAQLVIESSLQRNVKNHLILRCAGLYGEDRHPSFHLTGKQNIPKRNSKVNLIGIDDILKTLDKLLFSSDMKLLNLVNSNHPIKDDYYNGFCSRNNLDQIEFDDDLDESSKLVQTKYEQFVVRTDLP